MKKLINKIKNNKIYVKLKDSNLLMMTMVVLVAIQPVIDLDYLLEDYLGSIPRPSTIIRFIILPIVIFLCFATQKKTKKGWFAWISYTVLLVIYFILHVYNSMDVLPKIFVPSNFYFSTYQEAVYILTLVIPLYLIVCLYKTKLTDYLVQVTMTISCAIYSFSIFIGDIVPFGLSTYVGYTQGNFISWFTLIFDEDHETPKYYTSKFFYDEGNTVGIVMFMLLPLMYYYFHHAKTKKSKCFYGILILIQSLSMMILGTRVATYGAVIVPVVYLIMVIVMNIIKQEKFNKTIILFTVAMTAIYAFILPYSPAVKNQQIDAKNDLALLDNGMADEGKEVLGSTRVTNIQASDPAFIYMFEVYGIEARYAQSISKEYYTDYYDYKLDPYFWVELILNRPVEERVGGRNIQRIFFEYKWNDGRLDLKIDPNGDDSEDNVQTIYFNGCDYSVPCLTTYNRAFGMGYSTFMNGSIVLEMDFVQQYYTLGPIGVTWCCGPWILATLVAVVLLFKKFKKNFNLLNCTYAVGIIFAFASAYTSGHTIDQFMSSMVMAMMMAMLLKRLAGHVNE